MGLGSSGVGPFKIVERFRMPRYVRRPLFGDFEGDEGTKVGEGVDGREGTGDSDKLCVSSPNFVPFGDGLR